MELLRPDSGFIRSHITNEEVETTRKTIKGLRYPKAALS